MEFVSMDPEFVTVYPKRGAGKIHASDCPKAGTGRSARVVRPLTAAALRNGLASVAPCCRQHETTIFELFRTDQL